MGAAAWLAGGVEVGGLLGALEGGLTWGGRGWLLGRLLVTRKHASWQCLPDELIGPCVLPGLPDNLPSVEGRQRGPLPCPACQPPAPRGPEGLAFGWGASPSASTALCPSLPGSGAVCVGEDQPPEPSSLWKKLRPWALGPVGPGEHAT